MRKYQGKTRRRTSYLPSWVTEQRVWSEDGCFTYQLEGVERQRKINLWQEDKSSRFIYGPNAWFRRRTHKQVRMVMRSRMTRDLETLEPVNVLRFKNPVIWD